MHTLAVGSEKKLKVIYMHTYTQEASGSNEEDADDVYLVSYLSNLLHHALIIC